MDETDPDFEKVIEFYYNQITNTKIDQALVALELDTTGTDDEKYDRLHRRLLGGYHEADFFTLTVDEELSSVELSKRRKNALVAMYTYIVNWVEKQKKANVTIRRNTISETNELEKSNVDSTSVSYKGQLIQVPNEILERYSEPILAMQIADTNSQIPLKWPSFEKLLQAKNSKVTQSSPKSSGNTKQTKPLLDLHKIVVAVGKKFNGNAFELDDFCMRIKEVQASYALKKQRNYASHNTSPPRRPSS